ncbi:unnamed protein product [Clavelina lepadiformis]|uniref:Nudix hydrolase domain-containing protein n=1 Tax=Clavelina lepadiformis TaxID=159417 RepID=A0ABP0FGI9_CLALP
MELNANHIFSKQLLCMMKNLNKFNNTGSSKDVSSQFFVAGQKVGILTPKVVEELQRYPHVFEISLNPNISPQKTVQMSDKYASYDERTKVMSKVIEDMAQRDAHIALRGWRNELYEVASGPTIPSLLKMERAAVGIFGVRTYGSHMNGFVNHPEKGMCLWIARRSNSKATFPGMLDNMVAGGISSGVGIYETMVKECQEEAGIPPELAKKVVPVGAISYIYEDERGIQPDVQYCFDLEVPFDFVPTVVDREVQSFSLHTIDELKKLIVKDEFKPNCAAVTLHFLIRKGAILPEQVPDYLELIRLLHVQF